MLDHNAYKNVTGKITKLEAKFETGMMLRTFSITTEQHTKKGIQKTHVIKYPIMKVIKQIAAFRIFCFQNQLPYDWPIISTISTYVRGKGRGRGAVNHPYQLCVHQHLSIANIRTISAVRV